MSPYLLFLYYIEYGTEICLKKTDAIVVFTGESGRINHAFTLYRKGVAPYLHISGKKNNLLKRGFISYDNAINTHENVVYTAYWMQQHTKNYGPLASVSLVTSDYHMPRCLLEARQVWPVMIHPHPVRVQSSDRSFKIFKEYHKLLWTSLLFMYKSVHHSAKIRPFSQKNNSHSIK